MKRESETEGEGTGPIRLALAGIVAVYVVHCLLVDRVVDDCYISFRYARHLVEGHGLVYNIGERVEGYTNFLWTLVVAALHWLRPQGDLLRMAQVVEVALGCVLLLVVTRITALLRGAFTWGVLLAPAYLALHGAFVAWSTGGLEANLLALLLCKAVLAELRAERTGAAGWRAPVLLALAVMTRPDAVFFAAAFLVHRIVGRWRATRRPFARADLAWIGLFLLVFAPYYAWRWSYYGWAFPNTFYAKVGGGIAEWKRGVRYLLDYLHDYGAWLVVLPLPLLLRRWRESGVRLLAFVVLAGAAFIVLVGGESLGFARFIVPFVPCTAVLLVAGVTEWQAWLAEVGLFTGGRFLSRPGARRIFAALALVPTFAFAAWQTLHVRMPVSSGYHDRQTGLDFPDRQGRHDYAWFTNYFVDRLAVAGRWLEIHAPPDAVVAATPAGSIGYHLRRHVIDMLGLNDEHIAHVPIPDMGRGRAGHEKGDGRYVLDRKPDYLLLGNVALFDRPLTEREMQERLVLRSENEIWQLPGFREHYDLVHVRIAETGLFQWFTYYRRKGVVER